MDGLKARRVRDACRALGISKSTLYKLASQGRVRLVRIAGRTVVPETEMNRLASEGATYTAAPQPERQSSNPTPKQERSFA
jgi:excisionase family DNA binding protein